MNTQSLYLPLDIRIIDSLAHEREVNGTEVLVYLTLKAFAVDSPEEISPTLQEIASRCGINKETASRAILNLERIRLINVQRRPSRSGQRSSVYTFNRFPDGAVS